MCGINGFNFKDEDLIQKMNQKVAHRGPDDAGFFVSDNVSLGHQRLSIIDLSEKGHQPMISEDGKFVIVFNGEIYNFKEIRAKLSGKYQFVSETDTEVILNAYREYGADCLNEFNGIFAFAIWDEDKKELFIARDRMGVKPIYYWQDDGKFVFSSEIKAILSARGGSALGGEVDVPREIDMEALNLYFRMLYVPAPLTMFKNIFKLLPAHYGILKDGKFEIKKYWEVSDPNGEPSAFSDLKNKKEAISKIKEITKDAVKRQLVSDRPVGVFLSGGIDSTAMLGITREIAPEITKTYSVGFDVDVESKKYNADFELARKTAEFYKTEHHELKVSGKDVLENIEKIIWHMDEPVANATVVPMYLLSKMAKQDVVVVLGGDGGDELFGGYQRYYFSYLASKYQSLPKTIQRIFNFKFSILNKILNFKFSKLSILAGVERFLAFHEQKDEILSRVLKADVFKKEAAEEFFKDFVKTGKDFEKHFMDADRRSWLVDESLLRTDKMTMANGLEERVPILDYRLVELANKIPTKWKLGGKERGKVIWIEAMKEYLPEFILSEKKRGWFSPMAKWLRTDLKDFVFATLNELPEDIFNRGECLKILEDHINMREFNSKKYNLNIIWALIVWQIWYKQFIK
jgi:asparagine synthase (glutamine-hydrolysing)